MDVTAHASVDEFFYEVVNEALERVHLEASEPASWYLVGAVLQQNKGAHYCLGVSGGAFGFCSRDMNNDIIGGATIKAVSTGITLDF